MPANHRHRLAATRRRRPRSGTMRTFTEITPLDDDWFERHQRTLCGVFALPPAMVQTPLGSKALAEASQESGRIAFRRAQGGRDAGE